MESKSCVIGGAAQQAIEVSADWLKSNGFNAVRLPLAADAILQPRTHPCLSLGDRAQVRMHNLALGSLDYVEQVQEIARTLAEAGVLLLLDMHVLEAGKWPDGGAVGGAGITTLRAAWERLADALCDAEDYWNVMGADLKNEPYTMAWNTWSRLASDIGSAIHAKCPRWLLFVQGVGDCAGPQRDDGKPCAHLAAGASHDATLRGGIWWGENLQAARVAPVTSATRGRSAKSSTRRTPKGRQRTGSVSSTMSTFRRTCLTYGIHSGPTWRACKWLLWSWESLAALPLALMRFCSKPWRRSWPQARSRAGFTGRSTQRAPTPAASLTIGDP